jgi:tRNA modification GTPase
MTSNEETIAAIATPVGNAGIGIVRISGSRSADIAGRVFRGNRPIDRLQSHRLYLGHLLDPRSGRMIDEVLLSYMKAPHSYTREDVVEINSHSGYVLLSKILQIVIDQGARLAKPGEFTFRAFLNGRMDLTQAEAVIDLINSKSERGLHLATEQIGGSFRHEIESLRQRIIDFLAHVEVAIDFPEEEAGILVREEMGKRLDREVIGPVETILRTHAGKRIWVDGVCTAIVGRVNAGKSSLLNRLLNEERAIVSPMPGTTRDVIESTLTVKGLPLRLMDTAGIREVKDDVERIGIGLTEQKLAHADLLLLVIDQSRPLGEDDLKTIRQARGKKTIVVLNKIDLPPQITKQEENRISEGFPVARISALTGRGLDRLRSAILDCVLESGLDTSFSHAVPNLRHKNALTHAVQSLRNAAGSLEKGGPAEVIALELKTGLDDLGEIIGESAGEEVLDAVFSQFCLGK